MIRLYGLTPDIKSSDTVEQMIPDLLVLADHFEAKDKAVTNLHAQRLQTTCFDAKDQSSRLSLCVCLGRLNSITSKEL